MHPSKNNHHSYGVDYSLFALAVASLMWLVFRTGTKPARIVYPCQKAALTNIVIILPSFVLVGYVAAKNFVYKWSKLFLFIAILLCGLVVATPFLQNNLVLAQNPNQELELQLIPRTATLPDPSNIYAVNGRAHAHINNLLTLMSNNGLDFYDLIQPNDVVIIKINEEWPERGGTNTDKLNELIQAIVTHPSGFTGEIVVADNGQWQGSMDWLNSNAEDHSQSTQDVVDSFSSSFQVSTYSWIPIRYTSVSEYSDGDMIDGYIVYSNADPSTGIYTSYPKFQTDYGTNVSFRDGIWNGVSYENRLKVINFPVLKSHRWYGVTGATKHYMGMQTEALANGHDRVATGGMGTLMAETGMPTLNIIDAIYVNAIPPGYSGAGPGTTYNLATRVNVLAASTDPVALDYWASKYILQQAADTLGYLDTHTLDPDSTDRNGVYTEAFGVWLPLTRDAVLTGGFQATTDEQQMNVYVAGGSQVSPTADFSWTPAFPYVSEVVTFNASSSTAGSVPIANFTWDFDDGNITTTSEPVIYHTFLSNNTYLVMLNVTDEEGLWNTTSESIEVLPDGAHNIAVANVTVSKIIVGEGYTVYLNVTIQNQGNYEEISNVTVYANASIIYYLADVTLVSRDSTIIIFLWNTTSFSKGNYTISSTVDTVNNETDPLDNTYIDGIVEVVIPGDINGDGIVELSDFFLASQAFGSYPSHPDWNPNADVNSDGIVELSDFFITSQHFGQHFP